MCLAVCAARRPDPQRVVGVHRDAGGAQPLEKFIEHQIGKRSRAAGRHPETELAGIAFFLASAVAPHFTVTAINFRGWRR